MVDTQGLVNALKRAFEAEPPQDRDVPLSLLAIQYAAEIDAGVDEKELSKIGGALLAALEALQMSPRARALAQRGMMPSEPAKRGLDQLRAARERRTRAHGAAALDTAPADPDA